MENERVSAGASTFGTLLRRYRLAVGLSQEALAERARISVQGIGALERGDRRTPQRETLSLLIAALALSPEDRRTLEAAAVRQSVPRPDRTPVTAGPWPRAPAAILPHSLTSFVGREKEIGDLVTLAREHRLITLTGPGGIGKTRLALEVGAALFDGTIDVRLVELTPAGESALVATAIASVLGVQEVPGRPLIETLQAHLQQEPLLLVLDSCEHVVADAALVAERLLRGCPMLRILATSREPLRVAGERIYRLPSLTALPAVVLFTERAQAADHRFALTDETASSIGEICARLDGIPLAIELAAARVTTLSVAALAEKLDRRFALLARGGRTVHPRQQTIEATIDWSYELLAEPERRIFERLSVFAGGCTLDTAAPVCADEGAEGPDVLELLSSLIDKSLIIADMNAPEPRYRILESFRHYGREKLALRSELEEICGRHALAYLERAEYLERAFQEEPDRNWHASARLELDNWRAVLEWSLGARNDVRLGQRLAAALKPAWQRFAIAEGRRWVRLGLELAGEDTPLEVVAELERADAAISEDLGDFGGSLAAALRAVGLYRARGDRIGMARSQIGAGSALVRLSRAAEAEPLLREALEVAREFGRDELAANILYLSAVAHALAGDFAEAREASAEALAMYQALGKGLWTAVVTAARAEFEFWGGDAEAAAQGANQALLACRCQDDTDTVECGTHANMAAYLVSLARFDEARTHARKALEMAQRLRLQLQGTWALQHLAAIGILAPAANADSTTELSRAARLIGFVERRYAALGAAPEPTDRQEYDRVLAALREALPAHEVEFSLGRGAAMTEDDAIEEALRI